MPKASLTLFATLLLSPVSNIDLMLFCFKVLIATADSGRISSDNAMYPANLLLTITNATVSVSLAVKPC